MTADPNYSIGVISDTHGFLHPDVFALFQGVSLILHAGDVGGDELLMDLETIAPVVAVTGNVDGAPLPQRRPLWHQIETPLGRIAMTHGHLDRAPSTNRQTMVAAFAAFQPDIVIYGHSHVAKCEQIGNVQVFNPGAAGRPRLGTVSSVGRISRQRSGIVVCETRVLEYPVKRF